ncbi:MAG: Gfo/Idh/MocA family protein [Acidobacteriaceae bacterium]
MKRIRTAIFGTGFMGRVHLEALRRVKGVDVVAIAGRELASAQRLGAGYGIEKFESDYRKILSDPSIDAVHICTPNALHFSMTKDALLAGKHILCEKPLSTSIETAEELVHLATNRNLRNCVCHNLRYYPMVQQMRRMREDGDLGRILMVQGNYLQDWLLDEAAWNWRIDSGAGGQLRTMGDIGTHWFDMAEHVTGLRVRSLCADLETFYPTRQRPAKNVQASIAQLAAAPAAAGEHVTVTTEDFGAVVFQMDEGARGTMMACQMAAGRKNQLRMEIFGTKASVSWNQERPDELWVGHRDSANNVYIKDPGLMKEKARSYADLPCGHSEGYDDTFKQVFRRFYASIQQPDSPAEYPQLVDGLRHMLLMDAQLKSHRTRQWVDVRDL